MTPVEMMEGFFKCFLCDGYIIDCTRIAECNHIFCKSCIVLYLRNSKRCPECQTNLGYEPITQLQKDEHLQSLIYKFVPNLAKSEEERRRKFWNEYRNKEGSQKVDQGIIARDLHLSEESKKVFRKFKVQICLEYFQTSVLKLECDSIWKEIDCNIAKTYIYVWNTTPLEKLQEFVSFKFENEYDPKLLQVMFVLPENNRPLRHDLFVHEIFSVMYNTIWGETPTLRFAVFKKVNDCESIPTTFYQSKISECSAMKEAYELIEISSDEEDSSDDSEDSSSSTSLTDSSCMDSDNVDVNDDSIDTSDSTISTSSNNETDSDEPQIQEHQSSLLTEHESLSLNDSSVISIDPQEVDESNELTSKAVENDNPDSDKQVPDELQTRLAKEQHFPAATTKMSAYPNLKRAFVDTETAACAKVPKRSNNEQPSGNIVSENIAKNNQNWNAQDWRKCWTAKQKDNVELLEEPSLKNCSPVQNLPSTSSTKEDSAETPCEVEEASVEASTESKKNGYKPSMDLRADFLNLIKCRESTSTANPDIGDVVRELTSIATSHTHCQIKSTENAAVETLPSTPPLIYPVNTLVYKPKFSSKKTCPTVTKHFDVDEDDSQVNATNIDGEDQQTPQSSADVSVNNANNPMRNKNMETGELPDGMMSNRVEDLPKTSRDNSKWNVYTNNTTKHKIQMDYNSIAKKNSGSLNKHTDEDSNGKINSKIPNDSSSSFTEVIVNFDESDDENDEDKQSLLPSSSRPSVIPVISNQGISAATKHYTRQMNNTKHKTISLSPGKTRIHVRATVSKRHLLTKADQSISNGRITRSTGSVRSKRLTSATRKLPGSKRRILQTRAPKLPKQPTEIASNKVPNPSSPSTSKMNLRSRKSRRKTTLLSKQSPPASSTVVRKKPKIRSSTREPKHSTLTSIAREHKQYTITSSTLEPLKSTIKASPLVKKPSTIKISSSEPKHSTITVNPESPEQSSITSSFMQPKQSTLKENSLEVDDTTTTASSLESEISAFKASSLEPKQSNLSVNTKVREPSAITALSLEPQQPTAKESSLEHEDLATTNNSFEPNQPAPSDSTTIPKQSVNITTTARSFFYVAPPVVTVTKKSSKANNYVGKQNVPHLHDIAHHSRNSDVTDIILNKDSNPKTSKETTPMSGTSKASERGSVTHDTNTSISSTFSNEKQPNENTVVSRNTEQATFNFSDSVFQPIRQHKDYRISISPLFQLPETLNMVNEVNDLKRKLNHLRKAETEKKHDLPLERDERTHLLVNQQIDVGGGRSSATEHGNFNVNVDVGEYYDDECDEELKKLMDDEIKITAVYSKKEDQSEDDSDSEENNLNVCSEKEEQNEGDSDPEESNLNVCSKKEEQNEDDCDPEESNLNVCSKMEEQNEDDSDSEESNLNVCSKKEEQHEDGSDPEESNLNVCSKKEEQNEDDSDPEESNLNVCSKKEEQNEDDSDPEESNLNVCSKKEEQNEDGSDPEESNLNVCSKKEEQNEDDSDPEESNFQPFIDASKYPEMLMMDVDDLSNMQIDGDDYLGRPF